MKKITDKCVYIYVIGIYALIMFPGGKKDDNKEGTSCCLGMRTAGNITDEPVCFIC